MTKRQVILEFLTPSWLVNTIGVTVGVLATGATIVLSRFESSDLRRQIFHTKDSLNTGTVSGTYDSVTANFANNSFLNSLPLLITWACVGLVVYFFAVSIARAIGHAIELHEELEYVHVSRQDLIRQAVQKLALRAALILGWFLLIRLTINVVVPYALAAANIAAVEWTLANIGYAVLAVAVIHATVYIHALFLRFITLRTRVFGN